MADRYSQQIDRHLQTFDGVTEWADITAFLTRFLRILEAHPQQPHVPHKHVVAKRLAQCLNPALPGGVHGRALDVYAYIFQKIGREATYRDLSLYSLGLFPFMPHAAINVKEQLVSIYERFIIPIGEPLHACAEGLLLALAPGLEEDNSPLFDRTMRILDQFRVDIGDDAFYAAVWQALISVRASRHALLNYLLRRMSGYVGGSTVAYDPNFGMIANAIAACVTDRDLLVVRNALDLLVVSVPLSDCAVPEAERLQLVAKVIYVAERKDMSLIKRLYQWLLGSLTGAEQQREHFFKHSKYLILGAATAVFLQGDDGATIRMLRILQLLMEKHEISSSLSDDILDQLLLLAKSSDSSDACAMEQTKVFALLNPQLVIEKVSSLSRDANSQSIALLQSVLSLIDSSQTLSQRHVYPTIIFGTLCSAAKLLKLSQTVLSTALPSQLVSLAELAFRNIVPEYVDRWHVSCTDVLFAIEDAFRSVASVLTNVHTIDASAMLPCFRDLATIRSHVQRLACKATLSAELSSGHGDSNTTWLYAIAAASIASKEFDIIETSVYLLISEQDRKTMDCFARRFIYELWQQLNPARSYVHSSIVKLQIFIAEQARQSSALEALAIHDVASEDQYRLERAILFFSSIVIYNPDLLERFPKALLVFVCALESGSAEIRASVADCLSGSELMLLAVLKLAALMTSEINDLEWDEERVRFALAIIRRVVNHPHLNGVTKLRKTLVSDEPTFAYAQLISIASAFFRRSDALQYIELCCDFAIVLHGLVKDIAVSESALSSDLENGAVFLLHALVKAKTSAGQVKMLSLLRTVIKRRSILGFDCTIYQDLLVALILDGMSALELRSSLSQYSDLVRFCIETTKLRFESVYITVLNRACIELLQADRRAFFHGDMILDVASVRCFVDLIEIIVTRFLSDGSPVVIADDSVDAASVERMTVREYVVGQLPAIFSVVFKLWQSSVTVERRHSINDLRQLRSILVSLVRHVANYEKLSVVSGLCHLWAEKDDVLGENIVEFIGSVQNMSVEDFVDITLSSIRKEETSSTRFIMLVEKIYRHCSVESITVTIPRLLAALKDAQASSGRAFYPGYIKCCLLVCDRTSASAERDRLLDVFQNLLEATFVDWGQQLSSSIRKKRGTTSSSLPPDDLSDAFKETVSSYLIILFPKLEQIFPDPSRCSRVLSTLAYHVIGPVLRTNPRTAPVEHAVALDLVVSLRTLSTSAKHWKKDAWDAFEDSMFLGGLDYHSAVQWRTILAHIVQLDTEKMRDVIAKMEVTSTLFSSRDVENLQRQSSLRRVSILLFSNESDCFIQYLPSIQQRYVDVLKASASSAVSVEMYMLLRVMLLRFSTRSLASLWPVVFTEMERLVDSFGKKTGMMTASDFPHIIALCQFADLFLTLSYSETRQFEWTLLSQYYAQAGVSLAIMDRLAANLTIAGDESDNIGVAVNSSIAAAPFISRHTVATIPQPPNFMNSFRGTGDGKHSAVVSLRRPLLDASTRYMTELQQLAPFFSQLRARHGSSWYLLDVDTAFIEHQLGLELFNVAAAP